MVPSIGDTLTDSTVWVTVIPALPDADPALAVIAAVPVLSAVTRPDWSTAATAVLLLPQVTVAAGISSAFWSRTSAVSCTVAPNAVSSALNGLTVRVVGRGGSGTGVGTGPVALSPSPHPDANNTPANKLDVHTMVRLRLIGFLKR